MTPPKPELPDEIYAHVENVREISNGEMETYNHWQDANNVPAHGRTKYIRADLVPRPSPPSAPDAEVAEAFIRFSHHTIVYTGHDADYATIRHAISRPEGDAQLIEKLDSLKDGAVRGNDIESRAHNAGWLDLHQNVMRIVRSYKSTPAKPAQDCCARIPHTMLVVHEKTKHWPRPKGETLEATHTDEGGNHYVSTNGGIYQISFELLARPEDNG
jgi:hypothetical protein